MLFISINAINSIVFSVIILMFLFQGLSSRCVSVILLFIHYFDVVFNEQMELLIKDFRISLFSIYTSIMESYRSTESSKGIYSIYIGTITY